MEYYRTIASGIPREVRDAPTMYLCIVAGPPRPGSATSKSSLLDIYRPCVYLASTAYLCISHVIIFLHNRSQVMHTAMFTPVRTETAPKRVAAAEARARKYGLD